MLVLTIEWSYYVHGTKAITVSLNSLCKSWIKNLTAVICGCSLKGWLFFYFTWQPQSGGWGGSLLKEKAGWWKTALSVTVMLVLTLCNLLATTVLYEEPAVLNMRSRRVKMDVALLSEIFICFFRISKTTVVFVTRSSETVCYLYQTSRCHRRRL